MAKVKVTVDIPTSPKGAVFDIPALGINLVNGESTVVEASDDQIELLKNSFTVEPSSANPDVSLLNPPEVETVKDPALEEAEEEPPVVEPQKETPVAVVKPEGGGEA